MADLIFVPPAGTPRDDDVIRLGCLTYDRWEPAWADRARRLLAVRPEVGRADLYSAAAAGDTAAVRDLLARDPALARARGGPFGWEPLLYACYSRIDGAGTLEAARLLLAAGADPNAGFLWRGEVPPFTALTGAFGEGEDGVNQPPHPRRDELARLLLDAGADPNDGQALYNCHFKRANDVLRLLLEYGLGRDRQGPWYALLGERLWSPSRLLVEELWSAARKGYAERVELLVAHGAELDTPGLRDGRTPHHAAVRAGHTEIAEALVGHGARATVLDDDERFAAACISGDHEEARALFTADPTRLERLGHHGRVELVHRAVEANRPEGIRLMAELGFELSGTTTHDRVGVSLAATPMHNAAHAGNLALVELLVELGADPGIRERSHGATPLGWAAHNHQQHVVDFLMPRADIFDALQNDGIERAAALLELDPSLARATDGQGRPLAAYLHPGMKRRREAVALLRAHGVSVDS